MLVVCANHGARLIARQTWRSRRASDTSALFSCSSDARTPDVTRAACWLATSLARGMGSARDEARSGPAPARFGGAGPTRTSRTMTWPARLAGTRDIALRARPPPHRLLGASPARCGMARRAAAERDVCETGASRRVSCTASRVCAMRARSAFSLQSFPAVDAVLPAQRSGHVERRCPVAQQGFPRCQLDKPTWRYLTSRRRVSCICRFPLGFLSHVSGRERAPSRSLHEHLARCRPATSSVGSYTQNPERWWRSDCSPRAFVALPFNSLP